MKYGSYSYTNNSTNLFKLFKITFRKILIAVQLLFLASEIFKIDSSSEAFQNLCCCTHVGFILLLILYVYALKQVIPIYSAHCVRALHRVNFLLHRFLAAPLWKCLLAACRLLPVSAPDQGSANDSTVPVPDVPCSDLSTSLQDIILNFLEAPHLRPLLLVHNDKSFVSMLNKSCVVDEFKHACKVC